MAAAVAPEDRKLVERWLVQGVSPTGEITLNGPRAMFAFWFYAEMCHPDVFSEFMGLFADCGWDEDELSRLMQRFAAEHLKQERRRNAEAAGPHLVGTG